MFGDVEDGFQCNIVKGDNKVFAYKKVHFTGIKDSILTAVIDGVKYYKEVWIEFVTIFGDVFVEFRAGTDLNAVFNRKGMKMKNVL